MPTGPRRRRRLNDRPPRRTLNDPRPRRAPSGRRPRRMPIERRRPNSRPTARRSSKHRPHREPPPARAGGFVVCGSATLRTVDLRRSRVRLAKFWCLLLGLPFIAMAQSGPLGISFVDTTDLRLFYSDPSLNFLVPHTARTFSNAFDWQRRVFGWEPSERTNVWLRDFADYGNAAVSPAPRTLLRIDVAPAANAFETN